VSRFVVLRNDEEQYGLYPAGALNEGALNEGALNEGELPDGWQRAGFEGAEGDCMSYVDENWTDPRPLSLRVLEDS
jgi:MbtH protein